MIGRRMANIIKRLPVTVMTCGSRNFSACAVLTLNGNFCVVQPNTVCRISHHLGPTGISALTVPTLFPVASSSARSSSGKGPSIASFSSGTVATTRGQFKCGSSVTTQTHTCQRRPLVRRSRYAGTCLRLGWGCIRRSDRLITDRKER